ncbi:hypothetical protein QFZ51_000936 [Chitinophaga sp. W3I9]
MLFICLENNRRKRKAEGKIGLQKKETGLQDYSPEKF